jgi:hypothetical protein
MHGGRLTEILEPLREPKETSTTPAREEKHRAAGSPSTRPRWTETRESTSITKARSINNTTPPPPRTTDIWRYGREQTPENRADRRISRWNSGLDGTVESRERGSTWSWPGQPPKTDPCEMRKLRRQFRGNRGGVERRCPNSAREFYVGNSLLGLTSVLCLRVGFGCRWLVCSASRPSSGPAGRLFFPFLFPTKNNRKNFQNKQHVAPPPNSSIRSSLSCKQAFWNVGIPMSGLRKITTQRSIWNFVIITGCSLYFYYPCHF